MHVLSAAELLDAWERGLTQSPVQRALTLLVAAFPDSTWQDLAELPVGERDHRLLDLREALFGRQMVAVLPCPSCGEPLESTIPVPDVHGPQQPQSCLGVEIDGYQVTFRLPASYDLVGLPPTEDAVTLRNHLLTRCVLDTRDGSGEKLTAELLPSHVVAAICREMALADPEADVELALTCPLCSHQWCQVFDISNFLWREIHAWAQRTLRDVHCLARIYGWREADVLALTPTRRQIYLELSRT